MSNFDPSIFVILFFSFITMAYRKGEKTTHRDKEIDDYWSGD